MVIIIVETWFPAAKAEQAGKKYLEVQEKFPQDRKLAKRVLGAYNAVEEGVHGISAWEIKEGKTEIFLKRIAEQMLLYTVIEGYKYKINTYLSLAECMPMIGLASPIPAV